MPDVFTDSTVWANLLAGGYDKYLEYQLRSSRYSVSASTSTRLM
jgi:hypothetical protein